jgi:phosphatidylinositol-3-phosphatase
LRASGATLRPLDSSRGTISRGIVLMKKSLLSLSMTAAIISTPLVAAPDLEDGIPALDHVFVVVLENHNLDQIIGNPNAPHLTQLANRYNLATNYNGVWHPSLPNYLAMITGDWVATDDIRHVTVGISDDDSPSNAIDPPVANASTHRWRANLPSIAQQLVAAGKDWRAYLQGYPVVGTAMANWPGDSNTGKMYAVKHNPFPYVAYTQDHPSEQNKQVPFEQLFGDLGAKTVPALSYIVPDQCRDMHGIGNPLAACGQYFTGADPAAQDADYVKRGDEAAYWLYRAITTSPVWDEGRNALFIVFDEGNGPTTCNYDSTATPTLPPAPCYAAQNFNDPVVMIAVTNYGVRGVQDNSFYSHYSLLRTMEAGFRLPYLGHAADASTRTLAPLLAPGD